MTITGRTIAELRAAAISWYAQRGAMVAGDDLADLNDAGYLHLTSRDEVCRIPVRHAMGGYAEYSPIFGQDTGRMMRRISDEIGGSLYVVVSPSDWKQTGVRRP